jgi:hypothetical protein
MGSAVTYEDLHRQHKFKGKDKKEGEKKQLTVISNMTELYFNMTRTIPF